MTKEEKTMYNSALNRKWDNQNVLDYAVKTAKEEGIKEQRAKAEAEKQKIVLALKKLGMAAKDIAKAVGLPLREVEQL